MITPKIRILQRGQIDDNKWNQAVKQAVNSLPYAYTWYMDALCPRWIALMVGEYEFIMPLPVGRKWGMRYVYQPLFCQQLGIFYKHKSETIIRQMISAMLRKFVFVNLNINYDNTVKSEVKGIGKKKNLILTLSGKHTTIQKEYGDNTLRNIKKGLKAGLKFAEGSSKEFESFTDFYIKNTAMKVATFKSRHIKYIHRLTQQFIMHGCGKLYVVKNAEGDITAGVIVIENGNRIVHLLPAGDEYARQNGGMHFLVDAVLSHYAGSGKTYDFEGSSVDSIARFYEGFGAVNEPFYMASKSLFKFLRSGR